MYLYTHVTVRNLLQHILLQQKVGNLFYDLDYVIMGSVVYGLHNLKI